MRLSLIRGATAGCIGAIALALVLVAVAVEPRTASQRRLDASLERSGVVVVAEAPDGDAAFDDPGSALGLAALSLVYGLVAGAVLAGLVDRLGRPLVLVAAGLCVAAVAVLTIAGRSTARDVGAQLAFWVVASAWLWWAGRGVTRAASPPRP